jgi:hypothetical protein
MFGVLCAGKFGVFGSFFEVSRHGASAECPEFGHVQSLHTSSKILEELSGVSEEFFGVFRT